MQRAFSDERNRNMSLEDRSKVQDSRLSALEREVIELRAVNTRLHDSEVAASRELTHLKERNNTLFVENEQMRKQIRAQDDAIIGAQHLKEHTDRMIVDYEKLKGDLNFKLS